MNKSPTDEQIQRVAENLSQVYTALRLPDMWEESHTPEIWVGRLREKLAIHSRQCTLGDIEDYALGIAKAKERALWGTYLDVHDSLSGLHREALEALRDAIAWMLEPSASKGTGEDAA